MWLMTQSKLLRRCGREKWVSAAERAVDRGNLMAQATDQAFSSVTVCVYDIARQKPLESFHTPGPSIRQHGYDCEARHESHQLLCSDVVRGHMSATWVLNICSMGWPKQMSPSTKHS